MGLFGLALAPGESRADGCHVPERPVLGLTIDVFGGTAARAEPPTSHATPAGRAVRRTPCSPLTPGPTAAPDLPGTAGLSPEPPPDTESGSSRFRRIEEEAALPASNPSPPERPPRG